MSEALQYHKVTRCLYGAGNRRVTPHFERKIRISIALVHITPTFRHFLFYSYSTEFNMGVERKIITRGNGTDSPASGDKVSIHYTGWLYDAKKSNKGFQGKQ